MGRWHDGEGALAHCERIRQAHRRSEVGAARSATDLRSTLPYFGRRVGPDPISFGARFGANDGALPWVQTADSISRQGSHWPRAESLSRVRGCGRIADQSGLFSVSTTSAFRRTAFLPREGLMKRSICPTDGLTTRLCGYFVRGSFL